MVWPDNTTFVLAMPCPHRGRKDAELWSFVQCVRYLLSVGFASKAFFCIDNSQLLDCVDWHQSETPYSAPSTSTQGSKAVAADSSKVVVGEDGVVETGIAVSMERLYEFFKNEIVLRNLIL